MVYSEPALWEAAKRAARERLGGHSARAMQLAGQLYRAAGGRYLGRKSKAQQSLTTWTRQDWTTKSGKPSRETGERYLPRRVIEQLSSADYAATTRAKRQGTKQGKQFVKQPAAIAAKVARLKAQANPRPRKYASAAEKQAAFRARFPTICVRVEPKTAETVQAIADASGRTQQETLLSMLKYAMTNRNWLTLGLTEHKQLPRIEEPRKENPTMKRKPTPAQIAARERFAEMARSGAFKRKNNPMVISKQADESLSRKGSRGYVRQLLDRYSDDGHVVSVKKTRSGSIGIAFDGGRLLTVASARKKLEDHYGITERMGRRANPAKKTVSQKISQLTREGYPQKQAVAIALSEERAGKVRRNPIERYELRRLDKTNALDSTYNTLTHAKSALDEIDRPPASFYVIDTETGKPHFSFQAQTKFPGIEIRGTAMQKAYKRNPRAANPVKRKVVTMIKYALVPDDGGFTFGMDDRTPVQFVFSNRDKVRGIYRSFALPKSVTSSLEFQQWASSLPGQSIIVSLNDLRKMLKRYT